MSRQSIAVYVRLAISLAYDVLIHLILALFAILCILPFVHILAVSLSHHSAAAAGFVTFWPVRFTTAAYRLILQGHAFLSALMVTVRRTVVGTPLNMLLTCLTAYPLSKSAHEFKLRNVFMWLVLFPMLFSGGLIPWFLVIRRLGLLNTLWALILPEALPLWNVILLMNFFREIPKELDEAAMIDGASHWRRLEEIYLPYSSSALATLILFAAVHHWNAWFDGMVLIWDVTRQPLQTFIRATYASGDRAQDAAYIMLATLPILLIYPFLQRYFVSGVVVGSLKG